MKATIDGVTYEGTVDEIRDIVENPPCGRGAIRIWLVPPPSELWPPSSSELWPGLDRTQRNWDGSPRVTC